MRKVRMLLVAGVAAAALVAPAAPARASCQTDLGDMCKFMDFVCATVPNSQKVIAHCRP